MNIMNSNAIQISKRDYFALPASMRQQSEGPMVLTVRGGLQTFVRVTILE